MVQCKPIKILVQIFIFKMNKDGRYVQLVENIEKRKNHMDDDGVPLKR